MQVLICNNKKLLDTLYWELKIPSQEKLARFLQLEPCILSRLRSNKYTLTPLIILRIHEATGWSVKRIRELAGDTRTSFYTSPVNGQWIDYTKETLK